MRGWRVALRIARREALRHRGRSLLVVAMVGLPVLGLTTADVLVRTVQLSPGEQASRTIGAADAGVYAAGDDGAPPPPSAAAVVRALGPGTTTASYGTGTVVDRSAAGLTSEGVVQVDLASPLTRGLVALRSGRIPRTDDEVLLTTALARRLHLSPGETWTLVDPARTVTVVGTFVEPSDLRREEVLARPGALVPAASEPVGGSSYHAQPITDLALLVGTSVPEAQIAQRLGAGFTVTTRDDLLHPPREAVSAQLRSQRTVVAVVATGLGILQVVLLAGAAFAVGARRQVRDLALVAAAGGERRHVRDVVLAGGVLAGLAGGAAGVVLGVPLAWLLVPVAQRYGDVLAGRFDVRPAEIALGTTIGLVAGVLAATLPARTAARTDVVMALSGRRGSRGTPALLTVGGAAAVVVGALVTVKGAAPPARASLVLGGSVIAELGFVACAPALVGLAARAARVLPISGRMALRDAARHRARSGPAVAAVMAALAGAIAISTYLVSSDGYQRSTYRGEARVGQVLIYLDSAGGLSASTRAAVGAALPTRAVVDLAAAYVPCTPDAADGDTPGTPLSQVCPQLEAGSVALPEPAGASGAAYVAQVGVGDAAVLAAILGHDDPAATAALDAGEAVVVDPGLAGDRVRLAAASPTGDASTARGTLTAVHAALGLRHLPYEFPSVLVSSATAARLGARAAPTYVLYDTTRMPTDAEVARANAVLADGGTGSLEVERGFSSRSGIVQLALAGVAAIVTIAAVAIATGLAAAEGRADLATLAAVGASPGLRRRLAMAQAAVVALLGAGLGVLAGLVPAVAVVHARTGWPLMLPWTVVGVSVVGVPLLAAGLAGVFTRSRLPLVARAT